MAQPIPIESNVIDKQAYQAKKASGLGNFNSTLDTVTSEMNFISQSFAPMGYNAAALYKPESMDVVDAAINATQGKMGSGYYGGGYGGGIGGANYLTPGAGVGGANYLTPGGDSNSQTYAEMEKMMNSGFDQMSTMFMFQQKAGLGQNFYTSLSNTEATKQSSISNILRNIKL